MTPKQMNKLETATKLAFGIPVALLLIGLAAQAFLFLFAISPLLGAGGYIISK